jgi:EthD domain
MIKVMWFLKRAEHLTLEEFGDWWINHHAPDVIRHQLPYLKGYKIDLRTSEEGLAGKPADDFEWDGIAEQWFDNEADYNAVYDKTESPTRPDTLAHTSRFARMVVREITKIDPAENGQ